MRLHELIVNHVSHRFHCGVSPRSPHSHVFVSPCCSLFFILSSPAYLQAAYSSFGAALGLTCFPHLTSPNKLGYFLDRCFIHTETCGDSWYDYKAGPHGNISMAIAFSSWYFNGTLSDSRLWQKSKKVALSFWFYVFSSFLDCQNGTD